MIPPYTDLCTTLTPQQQALKDGVHQFARDADGAADAVPAPSARTPAPAAPAAAPATRRERRSRESSFSVTGGTTSVIPLG